MVRSLAPLRNGVYRGECHAQADQGCFTTEVRSVTVELLAWSHLANHSLDPIDWGAQPLRALRATSVHRRI